MSEVSKASIYAVVAGVKGAVTKASIYAVGFPATGTSRPRKDIVANNRDKNLSAAVFASPVAQSLPSNQVQTGLRSYRLPIKAAAYGAVPARWIKFGFYGASAGAASFEEAFLAVRDGSGINMGNPVPVSVGGVANFTIAANAHVETDPIEIALAGTEDLIFSFRGGSSFYFRYNAATTVFDTVKYNADATSHASEKNVDAYAWTDFAYKGLFFESITVGN